MLNPPYLRTARWLKLGSLAVLAVAGLLPASLPAQEARFSLDPDHPRSAPGARTMGLVGWRSSPLLMSMMDEAGIGAAPYRRMLMLNDPAAERYIGEDFRAAEARGMRSWLTVVGTPRSLSPAPDADENQYSTGLPEYARYPPTDPIAWADMLLSVIDDMEATDGVVPDCVEIWNEPERVEWFKGTGTDILELYLAAASRIRAVRPGILLGGPGLAGWRSEMGMGESMLFALVRQAKAGNAPLDFVSWHHYSNSTELLYSRVPQRLRELGTQLGMAPFETIVSEWNIYPSAEGLAGHEFDGPHGAANLGGFLTTARITGLDHGLFFLDLDEPDTPRINDLLGVGLGLFTQHGIKKPSARLLEIMQSMALQPEPATVSPPAEWNVRVTSSLAGSIMTIVVTNDVVTPLWVFANRARDYGMEPSWLYDIWLAAGGTQADEQDLINAGLTREQAQATLSFIPEVLFYDNFRDESRPVALEILGSTPFNLRPVTRFTPTVNAPAQHQVALQPFLEAAENAAWIVAARDTAAYLTASGYPYTTAEILAISGDFFAWAASEGIPYGYAVTAYKILQDTLRNERLAYQTNLNSLPETALTSESAASAGVTANGRDIKFMMEPNTVMVLQVEISAGIMMF
jgi:hypothetical protein